MKKKLIIGSATVIGILSISLGATKALNIINTYEATIASLEKKFEDDRNAADKEVTSAKIATKNIQRKYDRTFDQLMEVKNELKKLKNEQSASSTSVEASSTPEPTPIPESTPMYTEFDDGKCYMNICGTFTEPGSGRVQISIAFNNPDAADDYIVNIIGSNGAADDSTWTLTANWDVSSSSLVYKGKRIDTVNGVISSSYDNVTGSLRFNDPNTLYWTDASSGNTDRGPFTKE